MSQPNSKFKSRLAAYKDQHLYGVFFSLGRLWQKRFATLLTIAVMALALLLPLLLHISIRNLNNLSGELVESRELSVFMKPAQALADIQTTRTLAQNFAGIAEVRTRTPEQAMDELRALPGFAGAIDLLVENPLPTVLIVVPKDSLENLKLDELVGLLADQQAVDFVQYDRVWRERLNHLLALLRRVVLLTSLILACGALLVVGNTIRLDVLARAEEISVMRLVGASNRFIRRPFLYTGIWYGAGSAALALAIAALVIFALREKVVGVALSYGSDFQILSWSWQTAAITLAAGIMLGWLGAWIATTMRLNYHANNE